MTEPATTLTFSDLHSLIRETTRQGIFIGPDQTIAASTVLLHSGSSGTFEPENLKTALGAIFCKSSAEQVAFYSIYDDWRRNFDPRGAETATADDELDASDEAVKKSTRVFPYILLALFFVTAVFVGTIVYESFVGDNSDTPGKSEAPVDLPAKKPPSDQQSKDAEPAPQTAPTPQAGRAMPKPEVLETTAADPPGWWDSYSTYYLAIRNAVAATPIVVFLVWLLWRWSRRQAWMQRRSERDPPELSNLRIRRPKNILFSTRDYVHALQMLRRHHRQPTRNLDVKATLRSTTRRAGLFSPVYKARQTSPEYLLLADRSALDDHQAALVDEFVRRARDEDLHVEIYFFDGDPQICFSEKGRLDTIRLEDLAAKHGAQRLLIASDGSALVDPFKGTLRNWTSAFSAWQERAFLVSQPGDLWGHNQTTLYQAGFGVIPLDERGLISLAEALEESGAVAGSFDAPYLRPTVPLDSVFPALLRHDEDMWLDRTPRGERLLNELSGQLKSYLGPRGYDLLSACAVFPRPLWNITLHLDQSLHLEEGPGERETRLMALSRLPWFRTGKMPDDIRLHLLHGTSKSHSRLVRTALRDLLYSAIFAPAEAVEIEVARSPRRGLKRILSDFFNFDKPNHAGGLHDHIFIKFVLGGRVGPLDLDLPRILNKLLPWKGWDAFNAGAAVAGTTSAAVAAVAWIGLTLVEGPLRDVLVVKPVSGAAADAPIASIDFSPTGNLFVAVAENGDLFFGATDGDRIEMTSAVQRSVRSATFLADGNRLFVKLRNGDNALFNGVNTQGQDSLVPLPSAEFYAVNGKRTHVALFAKGKIIVANIVSGVSREVVLSGIPDGVLGMAIDDEAEVLSVMMRTALTTFDLKRGTRNTLTIDPTFLAGFESSELAGFWHINKSSVLARYGDGTLVALNLSAPSMQIVNPPGDHAPQPLTAPSLWHGRYPVTFSESARHVVSHGSVGGLARVTEGAIYGSKTKVMRALRGHAGNVRSVLLDRASRFVLSSSDDETVRIWNPAVADEVAVLRGHSAAVTAMALSADNQRLLTAGNDSTIQLWDISSITEPTDVALWNPAKNEDIVADFDVKVGSVGGITGPIAELAVEILKARQVAADHVNANGGLFNGGLMKLVVGDSACDPRAAVDAGNTLVNVEKVVAIIGPNCSGATNGMVTSVTIPAGVAVLADSPTAPSLANLKDNDTVFRASASDDRQGAEIARLVMAAGLKKVAMTYSNDDYNAGIAKVFEAEYMKLGGTVTANQAHEPNKASYRSETSTLSQGGPEALVLFAYYGSSGIAIIRNSLENGLFNKFYAADGMFDVSVIEQIGADNLRDRLWITQAASDPDDASYKAFADAYKAAGGDPDAPYAAHGYDVTFLMALAIEKAGSADRSRIPAALRAVAGPTGEVVRPGEWAKAKKLIAEGKDINYQGAAGVHDFDKNGDVTGLFSLSVVGPDGKWSRKLLK